MPDDRAPDPDLTVPRSAAPESTVARPTSTHDIGLTRSHGSAAPRVPASGLPLVPGYVVLREVARGGMGVVYEAHDPAFEREVAVKVMHVGQDAGRFVIESKVTAQLPHPGVPPVYALGTLDDGRPFLAMKLIEGRTLADELRASGRADLPRLLGAFERICETVGFALARGFIHRDLKPANVMSARSAKCWRWTGASQRKFQVPRSKFQVKSRTPLAASRGRARTTQLWRAR